jgi:hypothetical protein
MEKFNASLPLDKRMWAEDIRVRGGQPGSAATSTPERMFCSSEAEGGCGFMSTAVVGGSLGAAMAVEPAAAAAGAGGGNPNDV